MAKRHRDILAKLDPMAVQRYQIIEKDVRTIERYLKIIQKGFGASTWQNVIDFEGPYTTSIIIHEVVEIRWLQDRGFDPLRLETRALRKLVEEHKDAHVTATCEEHLYLQESINRTYQQHFEVATLVKANREDNIDLEMFLESDIGIYLLEEDLIEVARQIIERLKGERL